MFTLFNTCTILKLTSCANVHIFTFAFRCCLFCASTHTPRVSHLLFSDIVINEYSLNVETTPTVLVNIKISVHNGDGPIDTMLNNNGLNIGDGLNFVRCEQTLF